MIFIVLPMKEAHGLWVPLQSPPLTDLIHLGSRFCHPLVSGGPSLHCQRVQLAQPAGNSESGKSVSLGADSIPGVSHLKHLCWYILI